MARPGPAGRRTPTAADWARFSGQWRAELDERITRLTLLRDQLAGCIGCGCLSLEACPLRNPFDELGGEGVGPRLLDGGILQLDHPLPETMQAICHAV